MRVEGAAVIMLILLYFFYSELNSRQRISCCLSVLLDEAYKYSGYFVSVCYESVPCSTGCLDGGIMPVQRLHKAL